MGSRILDCARQPVVDLALLELQQISADEPCVWCVVGRAQAAEAWLDARGVERYRHGTIGDRSDDLEARPQPGEPGQLRLVHSMLERLLGGAGIKRGNHQVR